MEKIESLKNDGNDKYNQANRSNSKHLGDSLYREACILYGKAIEGMIALEAEEVLSSQSYIRLKAALFLNLAAANFKLLSYEGSRRCCNVVILFCNKPFLRLSDMGLDDDLTVDIHPQLPITDENCRSLLVKSLYRRGQCKLAMKSSLDEALTDFQLADSIGPHQSGIVSAINEVKKKMNENIAVKEYQDASYSKIMTVNGGPCHQRKGCWSQSVSETQVYFYIDKLTSCQTQTFPTCKILFERMRIVIRFGDSILLDERLARPIIAQESTWIFDSSMMRKESSPDKSSHRFLILYLQKEKFLPWHPGCEWWDRVFVDDEAIDTMTCSISTDLSQLPPEARDRSLNEHQRFISLSRDDQLTELNHLEVMKKQFQVAEAKIRSEAIIEENAISEAPERSQINSLREEFPHIQFSFK